MKQGTFLQMPSAWVWSLFGLSMIIFSLSMLTTWEGCRFVSRPLKSDEQKIVMAALDHWGQFQASEDGETIEALKAMIARKHLRVMDSPCWGRAEERSTFGYTDERGRILLNPALCFSYHRSFGPGNGVHIGDLVVTVATLFHESRHMLSHDPEPLAYQKEWLFVRQLAGHSGQPKGVYDELNHWEGQMDERIACTLGKSEAQLIRKRVFSSGLQAQRQSSSRL